MELSSIAIVVLLLIANADSFFFKAPDTSNWVDPTDMFNYDHVTKTMRKSGVYGAYEEESESEISREVCESTCMKAEEELKTCNDRLQQVHSGTSCNCSSDAISKPTSRDNADVVYMRRFVNIILDILKWKNVKPGSDAAISSGITITLTGKQIELLNAFASEDLNSMSDVDEILSEAFSQSASCDAGSWIEKISYAFTPQSFYPLMFAALMILMVACMFLSGRGLLQMFMTILLLTLCLSFVWEWYRLYQIAEIEAYSQHKKHGFQIPPECRPQKTWSDSFHKLWSQYFQLGDACQKYHESIMLDPMLKVSPIRAVVETLSVVLFVPVKHFGAALADFSLSALEKFPVTYQWILFPIIVVVAVFIFMVLILACCGGRLRLPFFLGSIDFAGVPAERLYAAANQPTAIQDRPRIQELRLTSDSSDAAYENSPYVIVRQKPNKPLSKRSLERLLLELTSSSPVRRSRSLDDMTDVSLEDCPHCYAQSVPRDGYVDGSHHVPCACKNHTCADNSPREFTRATSVPSSSRQHRRSNSPGFSEVQPRRSTEFLQEISAILEDSPKNTSVSDIDLK